MTGTAPGPASASTSPAAPELAPDLLVVEDDDATLEVLATVLRTHGYHVRTARTGAEALEQALRAEPDTVVLDLGLPDVDGLDVAARLAAVVRSPVLVLTADGAEDRKVAALDGGAIDYVTKPFSMPELLARVRVALRHRRLLDATDEDRRLEVGALVLDPGGHVATLDGEDLLLTPKEFALLVLLARAPGRVVSHRAIVDHVWGDGGSLTTLRIHVNQLRRKLGAGPRVPELVTEPRVGYRLLAPG